MGQACTIVLRGATPASFKVLHDPIWKTDTLIADFGESASR